MMKKDGDVVDIAVMAISSLQRTKGGDIDSELEYLGKRIAENNQNVFLGYNAQVYWDLKKRAKAGEFI